MYSTYEGGHFLWCFSIVSNKLARQGRAGHLVPQCAASCCCEAQAAGGLAGGRAGGRSLAVGWMAHCLVLFTYLPACRCLALPAKLRS